MVRLFQHQLPVVTLLRLVLEASFFFMAIIMGVMLHRRGLAPPYDVVPAAMLFSGVMVAAINLFGIYQRGPDSRPVGVAARLALAVIAGVPAAYAAFNFVPEGHAYQDALGLTIVIALGGMLVLRRGFLDSVDSKLFAHRVLVLGTGASARSVAEALAEMGGPALSFVGFYPLASAEKDAVPPERVLATTEALQATVARYRVNEVIVAVQERRGGVLPLGELLGCRLSGVRVTDLTSFFERTRGEFPIESLKASHLIFGEGFRQGRVRTVLKRAFDLVASLFLFVIFAPVMVLTAIAIKLESPGPVIYRQERVGARGRVFNILKFRSMRADAEHDGQPRWAAADDDRVTRVGRFIRRMRIDELPQLFNVLAGDMSLVGPRPERPYFVEQLTQQIPFYGLRHSVKPGITGWAQVRYNYGATFEDSVRKLQYELYYVKNHSLALDVVILIETIGVVLGGKGAR
ncbi:MAG: TIGR03013 family PEP-CTERM/XrtA system glycosyltransferase [Burkholderiales bacterium]|nr:TIGR03013 family PEP-CTERM/XrtA system glycosyltransferase [Burkholderiales bacterium]